MNVRKFLSWSLLWNIFSCPALALYNGQNVYDKQYTTSGFVFFFQTTEERENGRYALTYYRKCAGTIWADHKIVLPAHCFDDIRDLFMIYGNMTAPLPERFNYRTETYNAVNPIQPSKASESWDWKLADESDHTLIEVAKYDAQLDKHENFSAEELVSGDFRRKPLGVFAYKHDVAVLTIRDYPPGLFTGHIIPPCHINEKHNFSEAYLLGVGEQRFVRGYAVPNVKMLKFGSLEEEEEKDNIHDDPTQCEFNNYPYEQPNPPTKEENLCMEGKHLCHNDFGAPLYIKSSYEHDWCIWAMWSYSMMDVQLLHSRLDATEAGNVCPLGECYFNDWAIFQRVTDYFIWGESIN